MLMKHIALGRLIAAPALRGKTRKTNGPGLCDGHRSGFPASRSPARCTPWELYITFSRSRVRLQSHASTSPLMSYEAPIGSTPLLMLGYCAATSVQWVHTPSDECLL